MKQLQCILIKNDCYKQGDLLSPTRIVVHSTGAANTQISRYVQPHKDQAIGMGGLTYSKLIDLLGKNKYDNDWNHSGITKCVHAFIGKLSDGSIAAVQTLPWNIKCWGVGKGTKGSFNGSAIQFEMCEDEHSSKEYCKKVFDEATDLCAMLCQKYNIPVKNIVSHKEAHDMGYGSNHGDPESWWNKFGFTMDQFRKAVDKKINSNSSVPYKVKVNVDSLNIRAGASTQYKINGKITDHGVYTIVKEQNGWGFLKSGAGWISLKYTNKHE